MPRRRLPPGMPSRHPRHVLLFFTLSACLLCAQLPHFAAAATLRRPLLPGTPAPYDTNRTSLDYTACNATTGCKGDQCKLKIDLTYPLLSQDPPASAPVVVLISGFQAQMSFYHYLASALASQGFVVLQYQTSATLGDAISRCLKGGLRKCFQLETITDAMELKFLDPILQYSEQYSRKELPIADFSTLALVGHSRGGKLAALHYATDTNFKFKAALLVDPVDATLFSPVSEEYPSALQALASNPRPLAIAGAGIGWNRLPLLNCNPGQSNSTQFAKVAAPGSSYFALLPRSGHMQFIQAASWIEFGFNALCQGTTPANGNKVARQVAEELAVAWMVNQLRGGPALDAKGSRLCALVEELGRGSLQLQVKGLNGSWREAACGKSSQPPAT